MTFTDYGVIDELHQMVEPLKNRVALAKIRTVNLIDNTHTGINEAWKSSLGEIKEMVGQKLDEKMEIGLRSVLVSVFDTSIENIEIPLDTEGKNLIEISVPTTVSLIRSGTEKDDGIFRVVRVENMDMLNDLNKLFHTKAYYDEGVEYCTKHPDLVCRGLRPAIVVYDMSKLEYQKEYKYKIKSETDRENAIISLIVTDFDNKKTVQ